MPKIVRFHQTGGPEVLKIEELPLVEARQGRNPYEGGGDRAQPGRDHVPERPIS